MSRGVGMTEVEYKRALKDLVITVVAGGGLIYLFFILGFIFDIH